MKRLDKDFESSVVCELANRHNTRTRTYYGRQLYRDSVAAARNAERICNDGHKVKCIGGLTPKHEAAIRREYGNTWAIDKHAINSLAKFDPAIEVMKKQLLYAADAAEKGGW